MRSGFPLLALVVLAGCLSPAERQLESRFHQAVALQARKQYLEALEVYAGAYRSTTDEEWRAKIRARIDECVRGVLSQAEALELQGDWRGAIQMYIGLQARAGEYVDAGLLRRRLDAARREAYRDAVTRAGRLRSDGRWEEALEVLEGAGGIARQIGRSEDLEARLAPVRERVLQRRLERAAAAEESGNYEKAVSIYTSSSALAGKVGRAGDVEARLRKARESLVEQGLARARDAESRGDWAAAVREYERIEPHARAVGRPLDWASRKRRAEVKAALEAAPSLPPAQAVRRLEGVLDRADEAGLRAELEEALLAARRRLFEQRIQAVKHFEESRLWSRAHRTLQEIAPLAKQLGETERYRRALDRVELSWLEWALEQAVRMIRVEQFDEAERLLEAVRGIADRRGRAREVQALQDKIRRGRFEAALDRGRRLVRQERFDEALRLYESLRIPAAELAMEADLDAALRRCWEAAFDYHVARGRHYERLERYAAAIEEYRRAEPFARPLGRSGEIDFLIRRARERAAGDFPPGWTRRDTLRFSQDVSCAAFDPTGGRFAVGTRGHRVLVYTADCRQRFVFKVDHDPRELRFSADGRLLFAACRRHVSVWDVTNGECLHILVHQHNVTSIAVSGRILLAGLANGDVGVWDWPEEDLLGRLEGHRAAVVSIRFIRGGFVSVCRHGELRVWRSNPWRCIRVLQAHQGGCRSISAGPGNRWIVTCGTDDHIRIWDTRTWKTVHEIHCPGAVRAIFGPGGRTVIAVDASGYIVLLEPGKKEPVWKVRAHSGAAVWIGTMPGGRSLVTCGTDRKVSVWQLR